MSRPSWQGLAPLSLVNMSHWHRPQPPTAWRGGSWSPGATITHCLNSRDLYGTVEWKQYLVWLDLFLDTETGSSTYQDTPTHKLLIAKGQCAQCDVTFRGGVWKKYINDTNILHRWFITFNQVSLWRELRCLASGKSCCKICSGLLSVTDWEDWTIKKKTEPCGKFK